MGYRGTLEICSEGHDEVCYSTDGCPACKIREDLELQIEDLTEDIAKLEDQIKEYEAEEISVLEDK